MMEKNNEKSYQEVSNTKVGTKDLTTTGQPITGNPPEKQIQVFEKWAMSAKQGFLTIASEKTWNKEIIFALQIFRGNETLQKSDPQSIRNAIVNIATTGATLNPALKQAFLIPRKVNDVTMCCLDFSYRGLASLAIDTGAVLDMDATAVHEKDKFEYEMGLEPKLVHKPCMEQDAGSMTHVYAIAILKNGIRKFIVLNKAEVEKVRQASQAPNSPMWVKWYEEGARKTAIKKLYKLLPQNEKMSEAIEIINKHEGIDFDAKQPSKLEERLGQDIEKSSEPRIIPASEVTGITGKGGNGGTVTPPIGEQGDDGPKGGRSLNYNGGKGTGSTGGEGHAQEYPLEGNVIEGFVISDAEAEAIRQREIKESGSSELSKPELKNKPYIKPKPPGSLF
jgi:phage RecT family recombinase